jgi:hypothetical protein
MPVAPARYFDQRNLKKDPRNHTGGKQEKVGSTKPTSKSIGTAAERCLKPQEDKEDAIANSIMYAALLPAAQACRVKLRCISNRSQVVPLQ